MFGVYSNGKLIKEYEIFLEAVNHAECYTDTETGVGPSVRPIKSEVQEKENG